MHTKESLWLKFVRGWFGIDTRLDERQLAEVERIGNNAYILSSIAELIVLFLSFLFVFTNQIAVAYTFLGLATATILLVSVCYTSLTLKKLGLFQVEITPDQRPESVRKIFLKAIPELLVCFIFATFGAALGNSIVNNGRLVNVLSYWSQGLFFSVCIIIGTIIGKLRRLKVIKDDDD